MKARFSAVQATVQLSRGGRGFFDRENLRALAIQQRESPTPEALDAILTLLAYSGEEETLDVPLQAIPLVVDQMLSTLLPKPAGSVETRAGSVPIAPTAAQIAEWERIQTVVRLGYALDVDGSPLKPEAKFPDWRTAKATDLHAYSEAVWAEMSDAGLLSADFTALVQAMNRLNTRAVGELIRPKA